MPSVIYFRIAGNGVTLALQVINTVVMLSALKGQIMEDEEIRTMASMQSRFMTVWNVTFLMAYTSLALACDLLAVTNRDYLLPKFTKKFRDFFFSSVVFPGSLLVFTVFWPFYIYDRNIIYPEFIDKVFYQESGYVIHITIVPSVLWELAYLPLKTPGSHRLSVATLILYYLVYNAFVHYTYFDRGLWPYPLMGLLYGTVYNVILHTYLVIILFSTYYLQWPLKNYFWGKDGSQVKSKLT